MPIRYIPVYTSEELARITAEQKKKMAQQLPINNAQKQIKKEVK